MDGLARQPLRSTTTPLLVDRDAERQRLHELLDTAIAGQGQVALIGGEAGIGKTALAEAIGRHAATCGALVLTGHCYDLNETPPYGPWLELLGQLRADDPTLPALRAALSPSAPPGGSQLALFQRLREVIVELARRQPLVVLLDDLHWADAASLDLTRFVARTLVDLPVLLLVTYRNEQLATTPAFAQRLPLLLREAPVAHLELRPLRAASVAALVVERYQLAPAAVAQLSAYLGTHAEGNPLFVQELLQALEETGMLQQTAAGWEVSDLTQARVPALLSQIITSRLFRLGKEARDLLRVAAVIGAEVPYDLWLAASADDDDVLDGVVEQAIGVGMLEEHGDGSGVRFRHALFRDAVYGGIPALRRRRLHRQVGDILLKQPAPDPDTVAYHLRQAGDERAATWLVRAGRRAQRGYAWLTAAERYEAALALMARDKRESPERAWLLVRLALMRRYVNPQQSIEYLDEVLAGRAGAVAPALVAALQYCRGALRCLRSDLRGGVEEMTAGVAALDALSAAEFAGLLQTWDEEIGDDSLKRRQGQLATWLAYVGRYQEAHDLAQSVVTLPSSSPTDRLTQADAYVALLRAAGALGRPQAAQAAFSQAHDRYHAADNFALLYIALGDAITWFALPYAAEDLVGRERLVREAERIYARATGAIADESGGIARYRLLLVEGRWPELRQEELDRHPPADVYLPLARNALVLIAFQQGRQRPAWQRVREVLPLGPDTLPGACEFRTGIELQRLAARLALAARDLPAARAWLDAHDRWLAWAGATFGQAAGQVVWAAYQQAAGDLVQANHCATMALQLAASPRQPLALVEAHRVLGELAIAAGRHDEARQQLATAQTLAIACGATFEHALILLAQATLASQAGNQAEVMGLLAQVREIATPLGAQPLLDRAAALDRSTPAPPAPPTPLPAGLTPRELEVLQLVAQGLTSAEVAERLYLSPRTVSTHLTSIYTKLDVSSRAAAIRFALDNQLV
ncbi:MAG: helix-turn-helix transcriptional regulator [Thermomicrobiales bacterium]